MLPQNSCCNANGKKFKFIYICIFICEQLNCEGIGCMNVDIEDVNRAIHIVKVDICKGNPENLSSFFKFLFYSYLALYIFGQHYKFRIFFYFNI